MWGPGVTTREQAFHYVDDLIADRARSLLPTAAAPLHLVDLWCGVGATLCYLAERPTAFAPRASPIASPAWRRTS